MHVIPGAEVIIYLRFWNRMEGPPTRSVTQTRGLGTLSMPTAHLPVLAPSGQVDNFTASTRDAIALAFSGSVVNISEAHALTSVFLRPPYASAWPIATQGDDSRCLFIVAPQPGHQTHAHSMPSRFPCQTNANKLIGGRRFEPTLFPSLAGKGSDYATVEFDVCLSPSIYNTAAMFLLGRFWSV